MASIQIHKEQIKEHLQEIEDAIAIGIEKRPATIGLHTSACSIALLELYLQKFGKIPAGATIKHEWFKKPKPEQKILPLAERKLDIIFPQKDEILSLMYNIEEERNKLVYGRPVKNTITSVLIAFQNLYSLIKEKLKEVGEEIE